MRYFFCLSVLKIFTELFYKQTFLKKRNKSVYLYSRESAVTGVIQALKVTVGDITSSQMFDIRLQTSHSESTLTFCCYR